MKNQTNGVVNQTNQIENRLPKGILSSEEMALNHSLYETELRKFNQLYGDYIFRDCMIEAIALQLGDRKLINHLDAVQNFTEGTELRGNGEFLSQQEYGDKLEEIGDKINDIVWDIFMKNKVDEVALMDYSEDDASTLLTLWGYHYIYQQFYGGNNYFFGTGFTNGK